MITSLNRLPNGNFELTITIPQLTIANASGDAFRKLSTGVEIKGFRKGKAPLHLIKDHVDPQKIIQEVLKEILPQLYTEALKEHSLRPIVNPQIYLLNTNPDSDWQIKAVACEFPKVDLGNYKEAIAKEFKASQIWVPGKKASTKSNPETNQENTDKKMSQLFSTLLKNISVVVPEILIEEEVTRMLSRLIDQTARLGLTIDQYLGSVKKTNEDLRKEYHQQAHETLSLEFILSAIADREQVEIADSEIEKLISQIPDEKSRQEAATPEQKVYFKQLIRKQKVIENLLAML